MPFLYFYCEVFNDNNCFKKYAEKCLKKDIVCGKLYIVCKFDKDKQKIFVFYFAYGSKMLSIWSGLYEYIV